jgi:hypothetical protein
MSRQTPDYGLDDGRAVRAMFIAGLAGTIGGFLLVQWTLTRHLGLAYTLQIFGFCCFWTFPPARTVTARKPLQPV